MAARGCALAPAPSSEIRATVRGRCRGGAPRPAAQGAHVRLGLQEPARAATARGRLIEACGLKGHVIGGARISPVHANFIENPGGARSADVVALIAEARAARVRERFGVELEHEVELLGPIALA